MATRSITTIRSRWVDESKVNEWEINGTIFLHNDGHLEGVGRWLYDFLDGMVIVNGIAIGGPMPERYANGPGRLACQIVTAMQLDHMNPSLAPSKGNYGEEYRYQLGITFGPLGGDIDISVFDGPMTMFGDGGEDCTNLLFSGDVASYGIFLNAQRDDEEE